jgi:hypothetical protein
MAGESGENVLKAFSKEKCKLNTFSSVFAFIETGFVVFLLWKNDRCDNGPFDKVGQNNCFYEYNSWKGFSQSGMFLILATLLLIANGILIKTLKIHDPNSSKTKALIRFSIIFSVCYFLRGVQLFVASFQNKK